MEGDDVLLCPESWSQLCLKLELLDLLVTCAHGFLPIKTRSHSHTHTVTVMLYEQAYDAGQTIFKCSTEA